MRSVVWVVLGLLWAGTLWGTAGEEWVRADADDSGGIAQADADAVINYLYHGGSLLCLDAADANDDGVVDNSDAIYIMNYLYQGGSAPPSPFPGCGTDPTTDMIGCDSYTSCP